MNLAVIIVFMFNVILYEFVFAFSFDLIYDYLLFWFCCSLFCLFTVVLLMFRLILVSVVDCCDLHFMLFPIRLI